MKTRKNESTWMTYAKRREDHIKKELKEMASKYVD
jgi:hypothetical protein